MNHTPHDIVMIKDLSLSLSIGIHDHEKADKQTVLITIKMHTAPFDESDEIEHAVCYETVINTVTEMAKSKHYNLVETLANEIADYCTRLKRVESVEVTIKKPDIVKNAAFVGIKIIRT